MRIRYENNLINLAIPIDQGGTNLPIARDSFVSDKIKKKLALKFRSALIVTGIYAALDYFANISVIEQ